MTPSRHTVFLAALSGLLLGCAYPPSPVGMLAAVAFVPLFFAFESIEGYAASLRKGYVMLFVFNATSLYWIGGFTHGRDLYLMVAGVILLLAHPMFFFLPIVLWTGFRRRFGFRASLFAFPFFWVAFEYFRSFTQFSFPWLAIGNTQTYDLPMVQAAEYAGVAGLSFLLLFLNVAVYLLCSNIVTGRWRPLSARSVALGLTILALYVLPKVYGTIVLARERAPSDRRVRVAVVQPNIDPFEKWGLEASAPLATLERLTGTLRPGQADLILWPETAIPFYILRPQNSPSLERLRGQVDTLGACLLTGMPDIEVYPDPSVAPRSSKVSEAGERYDTFNSAMLLRPHASEIQKYAKMILVPFGERVPYSEQLSLLNAMQWNFGLGGWAFGREATLFHAFDGAGAPVKFCALICYESMYPGFVAGFVDRGAEFLAVITNDSWWGNTSGAYQHKQTAILRAVENRRWVVQCANGGISCLIDPTGHIVEETEMFTEKVLGGTIEARSEKTFFTLHGDWLAESCVIISLALIACAAGDLFYRRMRRLQGEAAGGAQH